MAKRPVFVPIKTPTALFEEVYVEFEWSPGFAPSQKKKNIESMHCAAKRQGLWPVLEVSTKSEEPLGQRLSAFNLRLCTSAGAITIESAYQGSKVFAGGGPYVDLYEAESRAAKKDPRTRSSGPLVGFSFFGDDWPTEPVNAFYDWLYMSALRPHQEYLKRLFAYKGFTDVEFNPERSVNCQARTCAILVSLLRLEILDDALASKETFLRTIARGASPTVRPPDLVQKQLRL